MCRIQLCNDYAANSLTIFCFDINVCTYVYMFLVYTMYMYIECSFTFISGVCEPIGSAMCSGKNSFVDCEGSGKFECPANKEAGNFSICVWPMSNLLNTFLFRY